LPTALDSKQVWIHRCTWQEKSMREDGICIRGMQGDWNRSFISGQSPRSVFQDHLLLHLLRRRGHTSRMGWSRWQSEVYIYTHLNPSPSLSS